MVSVVMASVALFCAAITLTIVDSYPAANTVNSFQCQKIPCSFSWDCPAWHYCDTHARFCEPCTPCTDASDFHLRRGNCMDPMPCIESLYARQDYACPKLRIAEGHNCSGMCHSCDGTYGSYLGTTCRANCSDGDFEVFSCIFLNEVAQWNVSRKPFWIDYETVTKPQPPSKPPPPTIPPKTLPPETLPPETLPPETLPLPILSPPSPPLASSTSSTVYHLDALAGIVAGTVLGVSVIVFFAILLIVCSRRKKRRQGQTEDSSDEATKPMVNPNSTPDSNPDSTPDSTPGRKVPQEGDDQTTIIPYTTMRPVEMGSSTTISRISIPRPRPQPMEVSDYNSNYTDDHQQRYQQYQQQQYQQYYDQQQRQQYQEYHETTSNDRVTTWLKQSEQQPAVHSTSSPSVVSLHSDRPGQLCRRPQEHSPPHPHPPPLLLGFRPPGSTDSGHPRGRCSSSNSLQHETMRKSLTDLREGELRRGPTEQSQETSSGFHLQDSLQDLNVASFHV